MFKKLSVAAALCAGFTLSAQAQSTGSMAFTAFNADEDGWSMVMLANIAANSTIFFSDSTATSATSIGSGESAFSWNTGASTINAGTVVRFSAIDAATRAASIGTFTVVNSANLGISATAETVYAFVGTSFTAPTTIITAVSSEASTASLTVVGLTAGVNAIKLTSSTDFAEYSGARSGQTTFAGYSSLVNNPSNWTINVDGDGTSVAPAGGNFSIAAVPEPESYALLIAGLGVVGFVARRRRA